MGKYSEFSAPLAAIHPPFAVGPIHFVGIGGIGMSGIAEVMHNLGYQVRGSDLTDGPNIKRLREKGVKIAIGHTPDNVTGADAVVISTAIRNDNPEVAAARARHLILRCRSRSPLPPAHRPRR